MAADEPVTWRLTDHVCRVCFGRVLERRDADGRRIVRCANCGSEVRNDADGWRLACKTDAFGQEHQQRLGSTPGPVRVQDLCCCGLKTSTGKLAGLKCVRNEAPTPEQPSEVMVRFAGV